MPQTPPTLSCPHCKTPLRFRQRPTEPLSFACPDCNGPIELVFRDDEPVVQLPPEPPVRSQAARVLSGRVPAESVKRRWQTAKTAAAGRLSDPLTVTWIAAGIAATALLIAVVRERQGLPEPATAAASNDTDLNAASNTDEADPKPAPAIEPPDKVEAVVEDEGHVIPSDPIVAGPVDDDEVEMESAPAVPAAEATLPPVVAQRPAGAPPPHRLEEIEARLKQRFVLFEQSTPIAFDVLRVQLEELAGVEIDYDESLETDPAAGDVEVHVSLKDATLAAILDEVARQAGLSWTVEPAGIRLRPRNAVPDANDSADAVPSDSF